MQEEYLNICGMPTKVITWGKSVQDNFAKDEPKDIVICIPGNPGLTKVYSEFLQTIHEQVGYPVWIIGHAGHELTNDLEQNIPTLEGNERIYGLQGQILYKQAFIEKYVPKDAKIHFIGHSIGAYMVLQLLKIKSIRSRAVKSYLIHPAIENIAESPNGKIFTNILPSLVWTLTILLTVFTLVPLIFRKLFIQMLFLLFCIPSIYIDPIVNLLQPNIVKRVHALALEEMVAVKERDNDVLKQNKDKIKLYYGTNDRWAPLSNYTKLKDDIPNINAEVCDRNIGHNFVFKHSNEMGGIVANWIKA